MRFRVFVEDERAIGSVRIVDADGALTAYAKWVDWRLEEKKGDDEECDALRQELAWVIKHWEERVEVEGVIRIQPWRIWGHYATVVIVPA